MIPFTECQGRLAAEGFLRYGKGRHAAALNFGDCIAYPRGETDPDAAPLQRRRLSYDWREAVIRPESLRSILVNQSIAHVHQLTGPERRQCLKTSWGVRHQIHKPIRSGVDDHDCNFPARQVLLIPDAVVHGQQYIKALRFSFT